MAVLTRADFDVAFSFGRSQTSTVRDESGNWVSLAADVPAFDHDADGAALGLLIGEGDDVGQQDRASLIALMLPAALVSGDTPAERDATVFHRFDAGGGEQRRAWYSRSAVATIDALLGQRGHHKEIGVVAGLRPNEGGIIHYRGEVWLLPELIAAGGGVLADALGRPLVRSGAVQL